MKKTYAILMWAILAVCGAAFVSCGNENKVPTPPPGQELTVEKLLGTWRCDKKGEYEELTFNEDNTLVRVEAEYDDGRWEEETENGTWRQEDNAVRVTFSDGDTDTYDYTGTALVERGDADEVFYKKEMK